MSKWVSKEAEWYPANEKVGLTKKDGTPYIYEGPDRAALFELWQQKVDKLGMNFRHDPDLINRIRQLGFKDMKEYLKHIGYDEEKAQENFDKNASVVNLHELPAKVAAIEVMGGGTDTTGQNKDIPGGFGEAPKI